MDATITLCCMEFRKHFVCVWHYNITQLIVQMRAQACNCRFCIVQKSMENIYVVLVVRYTKSKQKPGKKFLLKTDTENMLQRVIK